MIRPCIHCSEPLSLNDHDGWKPPAWEPEDAEHSTYCDESDTGEHAVETNRKVLL
ncbi:MAG: hypothetical protein JWO62_1655 [Acidimicrobiaceae bacterium]|nr:hypothetical protein [Acidimicrobiaceae bacterium]